MEKMEILRAKRDLALARYHEFRKTKAGDVRINVSALEEETRELVEHDLFEHYKMLDGIIEVCEKDPTTLNYIVP